MGDWLLLPHMSPAYPEDPMASLHLKLTEKTRDGLRARLAALQPGGELLVYDTEQKGWGYRLKAPSGNGHAFVQSDGQPRYSFADAWRRPVEEQRSEARQLLADIDRGIDLRERDKAERGRKAQENKTKPTVAEVFAIYQEASRKGLVLTRSGKRKAPRTVDFDEGLIARHIVPLLGDREADTLTDIDGQRMHDDIVLGKTAGVFKGKARGKAVVEGGAVVAGRVVELAHSAWKWLTKRGHVTAPNPFAGIQKNRGEPRTRTARVRGLPSPWRGHARGASRGGGQGATGAGDGAQRRREPPEDRSA